MKASRLNRIVHRWGSILIALPTLCVLSTGVLLQLKKQSSWIQPVTKRGSEVAPVLSFTKILEIGQSVPEAQIESWDDIDRLDVRPGKGVVKIRAKNRWEVQVDTSTGKILQVAFRRSDLIESIHDGSFFSDMECPLVALENACARCVVPEFGVELSESCKQVLGLNFGHNKLWKDTTRIRMSNLCHVSFFLE